MEVAGDGGGWTCQECIRVGLETVNPADATRCSVCEEPRLRKLRSLSIASGSMSVSGSMSISRDNSDASDALLMTPTAGETESCTIKKDVSEAQDNFGKGTAQEKSVVSGWLIDLSFRPFEDGRPESLPVEACRAWGLLKHFEAEKPPATLVLSMPGALNGYQQHTFGSLLGTYSLVAGREAHGRPVWKQNVLRPLQSQSPAYFLARTPAGGNGDSASNGHWCVLKEEDVGREDPPQYQTLYLRDDNAEYPHKSERHWAVCEAGGKPGAYQELRRGHTDSAREVTCRAGQHAPAPTPPSTPPSALTLRLGFDRTASYQERRLGSAKLFFASDPLQRDASAAGCKVAQQLLSIAKGFFDKQESDWCDETLRDSALKSSVDTSLPPSLPPPPPPSHPAAAASRTAASVRLQRDDSMEKRRKTVGKYTGVIAQCFSYVSERLKSLNAYCAICDEPHAFGSMLQPTVCTRPLCAFRYAAYGKLIVGAEGFAKHAEVLDLLVATTTLAAQSARAGDIFDPFPCVNWPDSEELALDPTHKEQHLPLAREVLSKFPSFERINAQVLDGGDVGLRVLLQSCHKLCHPLFEWIGNSNRAHLASVPEHLQLSRLGTRHQFVMLSAPPERQMLFDELKAKYGTTFVWHGSGMLLFRGLFCHINRAILTLTHTSGMSVYS